MLQPYGTPENGDAPIWNAAKNRSEWAPPAGGGDFQAQIDAINARLIYAGIGGVPDPTFTPSYNNTYGRGDRDALINVTCSSAAVTNEAHLPRLVDDDRVNGAFLTNTLDGAGTWIRFEFPVPVYITEARLIWPDLGLTYSIGTWQWQGSNNDGATWANIGASFDMSLVDVFDIVDEIYGVTVARYNMPSLSVNEFTWLDYRLLCLNTAAAWSNVPQIVEFQFKIDS